jgi:hypothetical protein
VTRPPRCRRVGVLGALAVLLATLTVGLPTSGAAAAGGVKIAVSSLTPAVATAGSTLQVVGTVTNRGDQVVRDASARLRISDTRLHSRAELAGVMAGEVSSRDGEVIAEEPLPDLPPGGTVVLDLSQQLDDVPALTEFGVYVLGIEVVGTRGDTTGRLAITRSLLPWVPENSDLSPTGFSWIWPLVDVPVRLANGTFANDSLSAALAPGGRLDRLLQAGAVLGEGASLTWAIDPDLVDTVADMADENGYLVATPNNETVPGGGGQLARDWLERLRIVTAGEDVLPLPYGDPDLVALVHNGLQGDLGTARTEGAAVLAGLLPSASLVEDTAWPINGYLDRDTLDALGREGVTATVLDGRALPTTVDLNYTPSARARLASSSGRIAALLADPSLVQLLARARPRLPSPVLAAQRVVAETAMITSELPSAGTARTIVAMPPRRWDPPLDFLDQLVTVGQAPWAAPVSLRELAAAAPPEVDRRPLRYPAAQRRGELPKSYLAAVRAVEADIDNFSAVLTEPDQPVPGSSVLLIPGLQMSQHRLESSWWRGRDSRSIRLNRERSYLVDQRKLVHVEPGSFTFGSKSGMIPLTLVNGLPQEVVVVLRLDPQSPRLVLKTVEPQTIGPNQKVQVNVPATAIAGGPVVVVATLHTRDGALYGPPVQLRVNVTRIGTVALVITLAAGVVLFLAAGVRVVRRVRAARRRGPGPDEPAPTEETTEVPV